MFDTHIQVSILLFILTQSNIYDDLFVPFKIFILNNVTDNYNYNFITFI